MIGVFIDTGIVLTMTALIVISTLYTGDGPLADANGETYHELIANAGLTKTNLVQHAVSGVTGNIFGNIFVAVCLLFFAFSTILSWNYFGKINCAYFFGKYSIPVYSTLAVILIFVGTMLKNDLVWELQDMFNQLLVLPNIIALAALSGVVAAAARHR
jgi:AGCS family alanine or glycine:cation symporter